MKIKLGIIICLTALFISFSVSSFNFGLLNDGSSIMSYNKLINELKSQGYKIDEIELTGDETKFSFLSVFPKYVDINGHGISVYEFPDVSTADSQAKTISKDGYSVGNAMIEWIDKPHFYKKDRLIVGYIGNFNPILRSLKNVLGEPITE